VGTTHGVDGGGSKDSGGTEVGGGTAGSGGAEGSGSGNAEGGGSGGVLMSMKTIQSEVMNVRRSGKRLGLWYKTVCLSVRPICLSVNR
jgi:hypothetical protein